MDSFDQSHNTDFGLLGESLCLQDNSTTRPSFHPSIRPSVRPSIHPSIRPSVVAASPVSVCIPLLVCVGVSVSVCACVCPLSLSCLRLTAEQSPTDGGFCSVMADRAPCVSALHLRRWTGLTSSSSLTPLPPSPLSLPCLLCTLFFPLYF